MNKHILLLNFILALALIFTNTILGQFKLKAKSIFSYSSFGFSDITEENFAGNFAHMIINPAVFIVIIAVLLQYLGFTDIIKELWLVIPFYWFFRFLYICWKNLFVFTNWKTQSITCAASVFLSEITLFFIIRLFIENNIAIFISLEEFKNAFWFAIIAYIAKLIWDITKYKMVGESLFSSNTKKEIVVRRYNKFYNRYHTLIDTTLEKDYSFKSEHYKAHFKCLLYAIMIYEDHNRPPWIRFFEYIVKLLFWRKKRSLGIMQVQTEVLISSETSIIYAIKKLYPVFSKSESDTKVENTISEYNIGSDYLEEVESIYNILKSHLNLKTINFYQVKINKNKNR